MARALFRLRLASVYDSRALADCQNLIRFNLREALALLRGGPFYFDQIDNLCLGETEVQAQIALRHDARSATNLVDLRMSSDCHTNPSTDCGAIALRPDQLDLDPILFIASIVA